MTEMERLLESIKELREKAGKAIELSARLDGIAAAATQHDADVKALRESLAKVEEAMTKRESTITDLQREMRVATIGADPIRERAQAISMFGMMMRQSMVAVVGPAPERFKGEIELVQKYIEQRATLSETTAMGGYMIPTMLMNEIVDTLEQVSDILPRTDFLTGMPTKGAMPTLISRPSLQPKRATTDTAMAQTDFGFGQMDYDTEECYIYFSVDNNLIELSPFALGTLLLPLTRDAFIDGLANWLINADGSASYNSITGILAEATADYISTLPAGKTAFSDLTIADLRKLKNGNLKRGRGPTAAWLMSEDSLGQVEDMDRTGKKEVLTDDAQGNPLLWRRAVITEEGMPDEADSAANKAFVGFGDLRTFMVVLAGSGIAVETSKDYLFRTNQTAFRAKAHLDIVRKPVKTWRVLKTAAV